MLVGFYCLYWLRSEKNTPITAGILPSHPRYLYEKLIYKDAIVAHPGVSMSGGLRLGY